MQKNYLREVVSIIVGKPVENIADILDNPKYVNEFLIAKKMNMTINQIRNFLYKFSDHGIVSSIRKKDKKKGWYTYFWKIEKLKCLEFLRDHFSKRIDQIRSQIKSREEKCFYICDRCKIEFSEENALLRNFTCNECGDVFIVKDDSKLIRELKRALARLKKEMDFIDEEIKKEEIVLEKKRERLKKIEKKKLLKKKLAKKLLKKSLTKKDTKKKLAKKLLKKSLTKKDTKKKLAKKHG
jgi:transcription factor E